MVMDFSTAREVGAYLEQPKAMPVGTPGKKGYLRLGFELDDRGRSILRDLDRRAPLIVQQELYFDEQMPEMPCVYILSSGGPNVDGDRYEQDFTVRRGAYAHIATGAATKLATMKYNYSALVQRFTLEEDAYMEYLPEPVIPCRHTRFISDTQIVAHPSSTLFYAEIFLSGRKYYADGEMFVYDLLSICTHAERPTGEQLFREKMIVRPEHHSPCTLGAMNGYDIFANVVVLTPPEHADAIYERTEAFIDPERELAVGVTHLPNGCGLLMKVLGKDTGRVKREVRSFCSQVRQQIKHRPLFDEFPWR